jgi:hypothetical protein
MPVMSCFCHLVIVLSKYILNGVGERGLLQRTPLLISTGFDNLLLNFIKICFVCKYPLLALTVSLQ